MGSRMKEWKTLTFFGIHGLKSRELGQFPDLRVEVFFRRVDTRNPHYGYILCFEVKYGRVTNTLKYVFIFKPISNQLNILVGCNLSFTKSLNACYFEMDG